MCTNSLEKMSKYVCVYLHADLPIFVNMLIKMLGESVSCVSLIIAPRVLLLYKQLYVKYL